MSAQEDSNGVERPIYYLSRVLVDVETKYSLIEKLCICLYFAYMKLKQYIKPIDVYISSHYDIIKHMLSKPILHSRIRKWAQALTELSLIFKPLKAMKGQIMADFIMDHVMIESSMNVVNAKPWCLYFDGSSHKDETGVGVLRLSPQDGLTKFKYKISEKCSDNESEYEALIVGLRLLKLMGAKHFEVTDIIHIPRNENQEANELAQIASGYKMYKSKLQDMIEVREKMVSSTPPTEDILDKNDSRNREPDGEWKETCGVEEAWELRIFVVNSSSPTD
ncbi:uncharacterized protein LOC127122818 [Lathyrus oleraceus]|uniref:uncharacterized protein LOC127122818 n=1 Tax=Pisum sativum TaxID=3888 RepID=UPI0021D13E84|nr:uncharacterized protein LOC127122818 [Pisum sativum]